MGTAQKLYLVTLFFLVVFSEIKSIPAAEDAIAVGETLTGTQTKLSRNGLFKFGFFKLDGTENWYLGLVYAKFSNQTIAWLMNEVTPLKNNSAVLNLTENGSLVLSHGSTVIWTNRGASKKPTSSANITNGGNLAVFGAQNRSEILWQSFDHPQNTWLPGMKISETLRLTSWKSPWDPSPGFYTFLLDAPTDQLILQWRNSVTYWESGPWNGKIFSKLPELTLGYMYHNYEYIDNGTYKYFTYNLKPQVTTPTRFVMEESGDLKLYSQLGNTNGWTMFWSLPREQCQVYDLCGAFGACTRNNVQFCSCLKGFVPRDQREWKAQAWSGGCKRRTGLDCGNASTDGFMELTGKSFPAAAFSGPAENCRSSCLRNCSCTAYAYDGGLDCTHWAGELLNMVDSSSENRSIFVRLAAVDVPPLPRSAGSGGKAAVIGGSIGGGVALLGVGLVIVYFLFLRRSAVRLAEYTGPLTVYSYKELQSATRIFSERLGGGGFGSVFKGTLGDKGKTLVAVKKLEAISQGEKQFRMEVSTIGTIQHVNLIRLRGFCSEGDHRMLVYDYLPNGSLDRWLFPYKNENAQVLDWKTRYNIALGTARGILYLHEKCRDCIIHCDIKPENILLDGELCPKVADFGLSKLMGREFSHVLTTMRGTRGYLAPEWISGLPITPKADVYSFGMTLLQLIAGQRSMDETQDSRWFFPTWAATQINQENTMDLLDKRLNRNVDVGQLKRAAMVGGWCIQDNEDLRPSMNQVVQILEGIGDVTIPPIPRSLAALVDSPNSVVFYWDKEKTPRSYTSPSTSSYNVHHSSKGLEDQRSNSKNDDDQTT